MGQTPASAARPSSLLAHCGKSRHSPSVTSCLPRASTRSCTHTCTHTWKHSHMHVLTCVCTNTCTCVHKHTCTRSHTHTCTHAHTRKHSHMHLLTRVCTNTRTCVHTQTYMHTLVYAHVDASEKTRVGSQAKAAGRWPWALQNPRIAS